jgi:hypothetical protein
MGTVDIKICSFIILSCFFLPLTNLNAQQKAVNAFYYAGLQMVDGPLKNVIDKTLGPRWRSAADRQKH